jgi:hypothetical protein
VHPSACLLALAAALPALDLPGIPGPQPTGPETLRLAWGNDAFGPGGGGKSDDFRTNQMGVALTSGPWVFGLDHSMLTVSNPSGSPVYWGLPDPFADAKAGAVRHDELTATAGLRGERPLGRLSVWGQAGLGLLAAGDLGGEGLQEATHAILGQNITAREQEIDGWRCEAVAYAGAGARLAVHGPLSLQAGLLAEAQGGTWMRWRAEALAAAAGAGGGMWAGVRIDQSAGDPLSLTHAAVAEHEDGWAIVTGWGASGTSTGLSVTTARNMRTDGQEGAFSVAWRPDARPTAGADAPWQGRIGLVAYESRVGKRGVDHVLGRRLGDGEGAPLLLVGYRDQELTVPYALDLNARRQMLWAGLGCDPTLWSWRSLRLIGLGEAGAGWRHSRVQSKGFVTVDGGEEMSCDVAIVRAALGAGLVVATGQAELGVHLLGEGCITSQTRDVALATLDPFAGTVQEERDMPLEGAALGAVAGVVARWRW